MRKFIKQNTWEGLYQGMVDYTKQRPSADKGKVTQFLTVLQSTDNLVDLARAGLLTKEDMVWVTTPVKAMGLSTDLKAVEKAIAGRIKAKAAKAAKAKSDL